MNIGIVDAEIIGKKKHRFPNLACMKISAYHKQKSDDVTLLLSYDDIENYDKVYVSKVFTNTPIPEKILTLSNVEFGGTGFFYDKAPELPYEIEHIMPDYHLYDEWVEICKENGASKKSLQYYTDFSIGFATRGCFRGCSFCVNQNSKQSKKCGNILSWVDEDRPYICCLDDNVFACTDWREVFKELQTTDKRFQFKQGCDERLLTDEKCEVLFKKSKWIGDYIFAFDNIKDRRIVEKKLQLIRQHTEKIPKFYCFCGYNHENPDSYPEGFWVNDIADLFERICILMEHHALPYIMRYKDYELSEYKGIYITVARWCNQPSFFKKKSFREFCEANGEKSSAMRYLKEFESEHPYIAQKYFDKKWVN